MTLRLSEQARAGWAKASRQSGCSITALLEAIGRDLDQDPARLLNRGADLVDAARVIDEERRKRR